MSASVFDALPYYDKQAEDPAAKAAAFALIEAEMAKTKRIAPDDPRLPPDVAVFNKSEGLKQLLNNYAANEPIQSIDVSKYQPPSAVEDASVEELAAAEQRGRIGEGHMALRNENIELLSSYGPNAWLVRNYQLNSQLTELQSELTRVKEEVIEVNRKRRVYQEATGVHLSKLEGRWQDLVRSTVQLEMACGAMEAEVKALRRKEEELKKDIAQLEEK